MRKDEEFITRCREIGKKRIKVSVNAKSKQDWEHHWEQPSNRYYLNFGNWWKMTLEYCVADFEVEVGFYTDILGLSVNDLSSAYAMFTNTDKDFYISITFREQWAQIYPTRCNCYRIHG